jgi:hypothetical protein
VRAEHTAALLALLNARLSTMATPRTAYTADKAPTTGGNYVAVTLSRRFGGNGRLNGTVSPSSWRLLIRAVGVGEQNAGVLLDVCAQALEDKSITVTGVVSTPIAFETEDPIAEDEQNADLWSGMTQWIYAF